MSYRHPRHMHQLTFRHWLPLLIGIIALYVIVPQFGVFRRSVQTIPHADYRLLIAALVAVGATFLFGAGVYVTLAFRRLSYRRSVVAQLAANFFNRILPAGVGGIGANYRYLRQQRHTATQATTVVTANNGLGIIGHMLLLAILVLFFHGHIAPIHTSNHFMVLSLVLIVVILLAVGAAPTVRNRLRRGLRALGGQLAQYRSRPDRIGRALLLQLGLTASNVTAFWLCVGAMHVSLTFVAALLIFTFGFGIGTALPTPGGLGGVEAGLVAGLVAYHLPASTALAAVLAYRLLSYWLPLVISAPVCLYATKHRYFAN